MKGKPSSEGFFPDFGAGRQVREKALGTFLVKGRGCSSYLVGVKKVILVPHRQGPQQELLQHYLGYWAEKTWQKIMCCSGIGVSQGCKNFKPHPQSKISVPLRSSKTGTPSFLYGMGIPRGEGGD